MVDDELEVRHSGLLFARATERKSGGIMRRNTLTVLAGLMLLLAGLPTTALADSPPTAAPLYSPVDYAKYLSNSVYFDWGPASDDVGIAKYELYVNGVRVATLDSATTSYTASNLPDMSYAPWRVVSWDTAGNRTPSTRRYLYINAQPPAVTSSPTPTLVGGQIGTNGASPIWLDYAEETLGSWVATRYHWTSLNSGAWKPWTNYYTSTMVPGGQYRFMAQLLDDDGRLSTQVVGSTRTLTGVQNNAASVIYGGSWSTISSSTHYGGSYRRASAAGASAALTFIGRSVSWVAPRDPGHGQAKVFIDGVSAGTFNTYSSTVAPRQVIFTKSWPSSGTHTIKIVNQATSGHPRIGLDAFMVVR